MTERSTGRADARIKKEMEFVKALCAAILFMALSAVDTQAADYNITTFAIPPESPSSSGAEGIYGINNLGQILGNGDLTQGGFLRGPDGSIQDIDIPQSMGSGAQFRGLNDLGQTVGIFPTGDSQQHAFVRASDGSTVEIKADDYGSITALGINNAGVAVGSAARFRGYSSAGYFYDGVSLNLISMPGAVNTIATGINDAGRIVGYFDYGLTDDTRGFVREVNGTIETFRVPSSFPTGDARPTAPFDINNHGEIVGMFLPDNSGRRGFVRHSDGSYDTFDLPNLLDTIATGINDEGVIVGRYHFMEENAELTRWRGFEARPVAAVPIPTTFWLLSAAFGLLGTTQRHCDHPRNHNR